MRYVCSICGYVYDEGTEPVPFQELPDSWTCPLCRAPKALFAPEGKPEAPKVSPSPVQENGDMTRLPAGVLAALCSNLAWGCEKQYKEEEATLFREIADYFTAGALGHRDGLAGEGGLIDGDSGIKR